MKIDDPDLFSCHHPPPPPPHLFFLYINVKFIFIVLSGYYLLFQKIINYLFIYCYYVPFVGVKKNDSITIARKIAMHNLTL